MIILTTMSEVMITYIQMKLNVCLRVHTAKYLGPFSESGNQEIQVLISASYLFTWVIQRTDLASQIFSVYFWILNCKNVIFYDRSFSSMRNPYFAIVNYV